MCNARGELGPEEFESAMRQQLRLFVQRQLSDAMAVGHAGTKAELVQLGTLKNLLREQARRSRNYCVCRVREGGCKGLQGRGEGVRGREEQASERSRHLEAGG